MLCTQWTSEGMKEGMGVSMGGVLCGGRGVARDLVMLVALLDVELLETQRLRKDSERFSG